MHADTRDLSAARHAAAAGDLDALLGERLPDLQALFAELTGEATRSPNKRYLARRVIEAAAEAKAALPGDLAEAPAGEAANDDPGPEPSAPSAAEGAAPAEPAPSLAPPPAGPQGGEQAPTIEAEPVGDDERQARRYLAGELKPRHVNVAQLRIAYGLAVGRETGSEDKGYLVWKIRQAQQGRVPVGPAGSTAAPADDRQVVSIRLGKEALAALDDAVARLEYPSRVAFIRNALGLALRAKGEHDAAMHFFLTPQSEG